MNQIQAHPASGLVAPHENYAPEDHKTGAGTYVTSENESHNGAHSTEVLEQDAQTKGRWFQYVKTKQFWITLLLGQGTHTTSPPDNRIRHGVLEHMLTDEYSSCYLYHINEYAFYPPSERRHFDPSVPIFLQLRTPQHHLHFVYDLQVRLQEMGQTHLERWMAVLHPRVPGCGGQLLRRAGIPLCMSPQYTSWTQIILFHFEKCHANSV
jgi:hypothetical protein